MARKKARKNFWGGKKAKAPTEPSYVVHYEVWDRGIPRKGSKRLTASKLSEWYHKTVSKPGIDGLRIKSASGGAGGDPLQEIGQLVGVNWTALNNPSQWSRAPNHPLTTTHMRNIANGIQEYMSFHGTSFDHAFDVVVGDDMVYGSMKGQLYGPLRQMVLGDQGQGGVPSRGNSARRNPGNYAIPTTWPIQYYEWAQKPKTANWTSYPEYSYDQFYRANPRKRSTVENEYTEVRGSFAPMSIDMPDSPYGYEIPGERGRGGGFAGTTHITHHPPKTSHYKKQKKDKKKRRKARVFVETHQNPDLTKQQQMVRALVHTIRDLVDEAGSAGVPESTIFLGFESRGIPHRVTKELVDALVSRQLLSRRANVLRRGRRADPSARNNPARSNPSVWRKLKWEEGRVVYGDREYKQPGASGVFVGTDRDSEDRDKTMQYIVVDGEWHGPFAAHHGQARYQIGQKAVRMFEERRRGKKNPARSNPWYDDWSTSASYAPAYEQQVYAPAYKQQVYEQPVYAPVPAAEAVAPLIAAPVPVFMTAPPPPPSAAPYKFDAGPSIATASRKPWELPQNAGPYLPEMFPYGQGGRPYEYVFGAPAKKNPHTDRNSLFTCCGSPADTGHTPRCMHHPANAEGRRRFDGLTSEWRAKKRKKSKKGRGKETEIITCRGVFGPHMIRRGDLFGKVEGNLVCLSCYNESLEDLPQYSRKNPRLSAAKLRAKITELDKLYQYDQIDDETYHRLRSSLVLEPPKRGETIGSRLRALEEKARRAAWVGKASLKPGSFLGRAERHERSIIDSVLAEERSIADRHVARHVGRALIRGDWQTAAKVLSSKKVDGRKKWVKDAKKEIERLRIREKKALKKLPKLKGPHASELSRLRAEQLRDQREGWVQAEPEVRWRAQSMQERGDPHADFMYPEGAEAHFRSGMHPKAMQNRGSRGGFVGQERDQLPNWYFLKPGIRKWPVGDPRRGARDDMHAKEAINYMNRGFGDRSEYPGLIKKLAERYPVEDAANRSIWTLYRKYRDAIDEKMSDRGVKKELPTPQELRHREAARANSGRGRKNRRR